MDKRPAVVDVASWLLWLHIAAGAVVSVLVVVFRDRIAAVWSPEPGADSQVQPIDFVPVIVVLYVVVAATALFLIPLFRHGHNWARHSLAGVAAGVAITAVATARTGPPDLIRYSVVAAATLGAVTLVFLWHQDARRFCLPGSWRRHPADVAAHD
ncbi:hypothetical protein KUV85_03315 [Nocardioides panacisoli]|uniref:hypothetical protein n=1 Tax=Nocardioides panacisoli TaxID=627624 RepID=UPI001C6276F6|nr:hypothetical protein [Nocardioides panacisoli]QYJ04725.1 hypothetical protein KUV85_03315 [Nocardioides panacisoli]